MTHRFQAYDEKLNRDLIVHAFSKTPFLSATPSHVLDTIADYPLTTICTHMMGKRGIVSERRKERP